MEALRVSSIDPSRAVGLYVRASLHSGLAGRPLDSQRHAQSAVEVAEPLGMPMLFIAQAVRAMAAQRLGDRDGAETEFDSVSLLSALPIEMLDATLLPILQAVALTKLNRRALARGQRDSRRLDGGGPLSRLGIGARFQRGAARRDVLALR